MFVDLGVGEATRVEHGSCRLYVGTVALNQRHHERTQRSTTGSSADENSTHIACHERFLGTLDVPSRHPGATNCSDGVGAGQSKAGQT